MRALLTDLGEGDPVRGLRLATVMTGVSVAAESEEASYVTQVVVPARITHTFGTPPEPPEAGPWISPGVADLIANPEDVEVEVHLRARRALLDPMPHRFVAEEEAMVRGEDPAAAGAGWYEQRATRGAGAVTVVSALIEAGGGVVVDTNARQGQVRAVVPAVSLGELAADTRLAAIELESELVVEDDNAAGYWLNVYGLDLDGIEVESLIQSTQFYDAGVHGEGEEIGLTEGGGDNIRRQHLGFDDNSGVDRMQNHEWVDPPGWWVNANPSTGAQHATSSASVIIGDLTRGQDPAVTTDWERRRRSGVARRATLLGMNGAASVSRLVDEMTSPSRDIQVVNMSASDSGDTLCEGRDTWSHTANELFEGGVVLVKSASNNNHLDPDDCRVGSPGSAIGAFTIAAYHPTEDGAGTFIDFDSSRGGTAIEGRGRSIIGAAAPTRHQFTYTARPDCSYQYGAVWGANCPTVGKNYSRADSC